MRLIQVALFLIGLASSQAVAASGPYWHRSAVLDYRVAADGNATSTETWDVRADTASIAHTIAQQTYSYMADLERVDLVAAYTRKGDGRIIPVARSSVLDKAVATLAAAPQFSAQTVRTIVFPQVAAGDTVHYELRRVGKQPMFPGEFLLGIEFGGSSVTERAEISITLAPGRSLRTASSGLEERSVEVRADGSVVRRWRLADDATPSVSLQVSTFADYLAVGRAYAARAGRAARPGKTVRALAQTLVPPGASERETAMRLYRYVASEIRYVALFLGKGRVVPRDAETVLAEGWGDCKDHAALLQALLAAQGILAEPALISLHSRYDLPEPPGLGALDHVVTYVPSLDLYLDSTAPYAPFGLLLAGEYDKPVVIAGVEHTRLSRTPQMPASGIALETRTEARIADDGVISGETTTIAAGPQGIALRSMAAWFEGRGTAYSASAQLQQLGTPGAGRFAFSSPEEGGGEYRVDGYFTLDEPIAAAGLAGGDVLFTVPSGLAVFGRPGKVLLSATPGEDGGHSCFPGSEVEEVRLALPNASRVRQLPDDVDLSAGGARYTARYAEEVGVLTVRREFRLSTDHELCGPAEFAAMRPALAAARQDQHALISLVGGGAPKLPVTIAGLPMAGVNLAGRVAGAP